MSRTTLAGTLAGSLLALFGFLGAGPIEWPRAAVLIAGCAAIAALGIFAHDGAPSPPASPASPPKPVEVEAPIADAPKGEP